METRRILGHHVDPGMHSPLTYSRDANSHAMTMAHVKVNSMLMAIRHRVFNPDLTAGERVRMATLAETERSGEK
eukprot:4399416-Amphidinium_carterae.1